MRSRALRVTLTLLVLIAIGAAAYYVWALQRQITALDQSASSFSEARASATRFAFDLRSAQQAYVAAGQNEEFWFQKVTAASEDIRAALPALQRATTSTVAGEALADAGTALGEFDDRDRRVRSYATSGQDLLASDVIFSDSFAVTSRILAALDRAGNAAAHETAARRALARRDQMIAAGVAAALAVLTLLMLAPLPEPLETGIVATPQPSESPTTLQLELRPSAPPPVGKAMVAEPPPVKKPVPAPAAAAPRPPAPPPAPSQPSLRLDALAAVCTDLARLADTSSIPAILERTASALDASGLVLWLADAEAKELTPIAAHGYAASVLARMGTLPVDAENATAAAFRTGLVQTVSAGENANGAIAAPLVSPGGCLGVMSAEVRHDGEKQRTRLAAASIVAAQLATIIGPPAARTDEKTAVL